MASIEKYNTKNGDTLWRVRYRKPDHTSSSKRGFKRKRDAEVWAAKNVTTAINDNTYVDPKLGKTLVTELATEWINSRQQVWKPHTLKSVETAYRVHFEPQWAGRTIISIQRSQVQNWVNELSSHRSPTVVLRAFGILKAAIELAYADQYIATTRAIENIALPRKKTRKTDRHYLTPAQLVHLANNCGHYRTLVLIFGFCGLRWGEALALTPRSIDFKKKRIHVTQNLVKIDGKESLVEPKSYEIRSIPIPDKLLPLLKTAVKNKKRDERIFLNQEGRTPHPQSASAKAGHGWWAWALKHARLEPMTIHDLRHTAASIAVSAGANVKALQNMLGHKSAAMTLDTYADLFDSDLEALGENINAKIPDLEVAA